MREPRVTPQLSLDFEQKPESPNPKFPALADQKVVQVQFGVWRKRLVPQDEVDSVLEDVLTNARKLNW
jgi:hypothetical protein